MGGTYTAGGYEVMREEGVDLACLRVEARRLRSFMLCQVCGGSLSCRMVLGDDLDGKMMFEDVDVGVRPDSLDGAIHGSRDPVLSAWWRMRNSGGRLRGGGRSCRLSFLSSQRPS